jgi:hypothetical protein
MVILKYQHKITLTIIFAIIILSGCRKELEYPELPPSRGYTGDFVNKMRVETERVKTEDIDESVTGLVAFITLMNQQGSQVTGEGLTMAMDQMKADFKDKNGNIYEGFGKISNIYERDGLMYLVTHDDENLNLDKMRVRSGSSLAIIDNLEHDEMILEVRQGVTVGLGFIQFSLNKITINTSTGDLVFNYGPNRKKNMNIRKIIKS